MASSPQQSFAEWVKREDSKVEKDDSTDESLSPHSHDLELVKQNIDPYDSVVNAELIGPAIECVYRKSLEIIKAGHVLLTIGGDHSIAAGTISAVSEQFPEVSVIWIDA